MIDRRSLLKALGACLGVGSFFKTKEAEGTDLLCGVCDSTALPPFDLQRRQHNATAVREIGTTFVLVKLTTGEYRVARSYIGGRWPRGIRLCLRTNQVKGLYIYSVFFNVVEK